MKGEKNFFNLYVINKFTKPMTMLVKKIMGSQTTTLLHNRFPKHVCIYGLTPCFTKGRLKISRRIKTVRNTKLFHVPLFYFLQMLYLPSTRIYARGKHHIRMLCPKSVFIETRIVRTNFSAHRLTLHFFNFTTCNLPSTEQTNPPPTSLFCKSFNKLPQFLLLTAKPILQFLKKHFHQTHEVAT